MTTDHDPDRFPESGGQDGKAGPRRKTIDSPYIHRLQRRHFLVFCARTVIDRHPITVGAGDPRLRHLLQFVLE
jgi:hypothetical protein